MVTDTRAITDGFGEKNAGAQALLRFVDRFVKSSKRH
jgi:hypothetical protein